MHVYSHDTQFLNQILFLFIHSQLPTTDCLGENDTNVTVILYNLKKYRRRYKGRYKK